MHLTSSELRVAEAPAYLPAGVPEITDQEFALFQRLIAAEAGIQLTPAKRSLLVRRLAGRLRALGLKSFAAYYRRIVREGDADERTRMLDCICTNETSFFREPRQFEFLQEEVLPRWRQAADAGRRARSVRVWCAACSTGEEPFSVAMVLLDRLPPEQGWAIEILATDLSSRALRRAEAALWPIERMRGIPDAYLRRYMLRGRGRQRGRIKACPELRSVIRFERLNLAGAGYPVQGRFDLILCRNVLIYFDAGTKARVVERLLQKLSPAGFLFVGHAESLSGLTDRVRLVLPTVYRPVESPVSERTGRSPEGRVSGRAASRPYGAG